MNHPPCRECKGSGRTGDNSDCLSCHATGNDDFDPFGQCEFCFGPTEVYPPYECEKKCEASRHGTQTR